jgi:hypothetical protein
MYPPRRTRNIRHKGDIVRATIIIVCTILSNFVTIEPKMTPKRYTTQSGQNYSRNGRG